MDVRENMTDSNIETDIAVIKATVLGIQGDMAEVLGTLKNHNGRIRSLETGQATLSAKQEAIRSDVNTRLGIFGVLGTALATIAGGIAGFFGK